MRYLSFCSGVEAASIAWMPIGWEAVAFSEIEPFPCAVLTERFPNVPNLGDCTKIHYNKDTEELYVVESNGIVSKRINAGRIDLCVGGFPCQSFSVAGKREGLEGASGLILDYFRLLKEIKPEWVIYENVPGMLSSSKGRDFGIILDGFRECGYSLAWRVLDAQYVRVDGYPRAVPQRRRRVFVVGHLGVDWRYSASVLFEPDCLHRDTPPRRIAGKSPAGNFENRAGTSSGRPWDSSGVNPTLNQANAGSGTIGSSNQELFAQNGNGLVMESKFWNGEDVSTTLTGAFANDRMPDKGKLPCVITETGKGFYSKSEVGQTLEAHEDQHRRNIVCAHETGQGFWQGGDIAGTLRAEGENRPSRPSNIVCAGFMGGQGSKAGGIAYSEEVAPTIKSSPSGGNTVPDVICVHGSQDPIVQTDHANAINRNNGLENCVCVQQNTRDEVRLMNGDGQIAGALMAEPGAKQQNYLCYENHAQDSRIKTLVGVCSQISAKAGTGGNNLPLVQEVFSIDSLSSNSMKSSNPNTGYHRADVAKTLDTTVPDPAKNQGGQCVVEQIGYFPSQYQTPRESDVTMIATENCSHVRGDSPLVQCVQGIDGYNGSISGDVSATVDGHCKLPNGSNLVGSFAIAENIIGRKVENGGNGIGAQEELAYTQNCSGVMGVCAQATVRRLTPLECERLMGFPDNHTRIPWRGKPAEQCPDSPRYKACGNSMCVNVMRWIGMRIELIERKTNKEK